MRPRRERMVGVGEKERESERKWERERRMDRWETAQWNEASRKRRRKDTSKRTQRNRGVGMADGDVVTRESVIEREMDDRRAHRLTWGSKTHKLSVTNHFQRKWWADVKGDLEEGGDTWTQAQRWWIESGKQDSQAVRRGKGADGWTGEGEKGREKKQECADTLNKIVTGRD